MWDIRNYSPCYLELQQSDEHIRIVMGYNPKKKKKKKASRFPECKMIRSGMNQDDASAAWTFYEQL